MAQRIVVAANRLPVRRVEGGWQRSPGGLVSALTPILQERNGVWIGWTGTADEELEPFDHDGIRQIPIALEKEEVEDYYHGFSNETVWPLYHDAVRTPEYHRTWWRSYCRVNERFADAIADEAGDDDLIWVHDYHLQMLPKMIEERSPEAEIRFFLHIPFPPLELYARLPWRRQIVEGLLGADTLGFQTERSASNFVNAATAFADAKPWNDTLVTESSRTRVVTAPISIDVAGFEEIARDPSTDQRSTRLRGDLGDPETIFLGADRLDYTKGIDVRLRAYETLLERRPDLARKSKFVQIGVPSRQTIGDYVEIRNQIEQIAGRINSMHGSRHQMPVHYLYESLSREDLVSYYRAADVMIVTPLVDGMNLVAKEYVASRTDGDGALLLSEFAGAARELGDALLVNPYDIDGMASRMEEAIEMGEPDRRARMERMRSVVAGNDVHRWARTALGSSMRLAALGR